MLGNANLKKTTRTAHATAEKPTEGSLEDNLQKNAETPAVEEKKENGDKKPKYASNPTYMSTMWEENVDFRAKTLADVKKFIPTIEADLTAFKLTKAYTDKKKDSDKLRAEGKFVYDEVNKNKEKEDNKKYLETISEERKKIF